MYIRNSIKDINNKNKTNVKFWVAKTIKLRLFKDKNFAFLISKFRLWFYFINGSYRLAYYDWSVLTKNKQSETINRQRKTHKKNPKTKQKTKQNKLTN